MRALLGHLPKETHAKDTWQHVVSPIIGSGGRRFFGCAGAWQRFSQCLLRRS